ncbi:MAG: ABC transporter permease [Oscillospiraceae bacterium]|nr:ABC transporter permease [Oscillospiraceae bacterium]
MNMYKQELRNHFKAMVGWTCAMTAIALIYCLFYPMIKDQMATFKDLISNMNPGMLSALGVSGGSSGVAAMLTSITGFFSFVFTFSLLCAAIQAMNLGIGILSKEERERTADFLMTKPVSRSRIFTVKLLTALTVFVISDAVFTLLCGLLLPVIAGESLVMTQFLLMCLSLLLVQGMFFALGFVLSVALKKVRAVLPISLGAVFLFYAISAFAVNSPSDKLRFLTPFQYFKGEYILEKSAYELPYLIVCLAVIAVGAAVTYFLYKKRNIHAV